MKKFKLDRIISIATLVASLVAIILVLKKPAPVAQPSAPKASNMPHRSDQKKRAVPTGNTTLQRARTSGSRTSEVAQGAPQSAPASSGSKAGAQVNSDEISAVVAQMLGDGSGNAGLSPDSNLGSGAPNIKDQQVTIGWRRGARQVSY